MQQSEGVDQGADAREDQSVGHDHDLARVLEAVPELRRLEGALGQIPLRQSIPE